METIKKVPFKDFFRSDIFVPSKKMDVYFPYQHYVAGKMIDQILKFMAYLIRYAVQCVNKKISKNN
jgi:hypothetical protein